MDWRSARSTGKTVVGVIRENNITFMAGSIAHAAFLSILPLLLLLLLLTAAVGNDVLNEQIAGFARDYLSPSGQNLVFTALTEATERAGASVLGVASLLWGMLRVFRSLSTAFDELYGDSFTGIVQQVINGLIVFLAILVAVVGTAAGTVVVAWTEHPLVPVLNVAVLFVGLVVAFYPMYYVFPAAELHPREPIPGTIVAAVGWVLLELVFGLYVGLANTVSLYGVLGAVILLLVWLYGIAFVLLVGAAVNVVLAGRYTPEPTTETERVEEAATDDAEAAADDREAATGRATADRKAAAGSEVTDDGETAAGSQATDDQ